MISYLRIILLILCLYLNKLFIEENIKIPAMTIHRPIDPFILNCDIDRLGVEEVIGGYQYVGNLRNIGELNKHPEFNFQPSPIIGEWDTANFYSRRK
jgi:hypothetical protein